MTLTKHYLVGLILSLAFILTAYAIAAEKLFSGWMFVAAITTCGILQAMIQCIFFLELGKEKTGRWHLYTFLFMALIVVLIVAGSLWIMYNLDYRMMEM